jgi:hypothetical protein
MKKRIEKQFKAMTLNIIHIADSLQIKTQKSNAIWIENKLNNFIDKELELARIIKSDMKKGEIHLSSILLGTKIVYWLEKLTDIRTRLSKNSIEIGYKDKCLFSNEITLKEKEEVLDESNANSGKNLGRS